MGLIRSVVGAAKTSFSSTMQDQWKEFFYCDSLDKEVLVVKGTKKTKGHNQGNDNIISSGSGIAVADGQCMIIVEQGKVVEICAEPGEFTYDSSSEPSIFAGNLGEGIINTFKTMGKRFTMGGDTGKDQRVYYFNTKEIMDNKFGTANPVPFRVVDARIGLDLDVAIRCSGIYSYKIVDPILFYANVCGNVDRIYKRAEIDNQLKTEFISALQPALAKLSALEIRPNQIIAHTTELENALNEVLSNKWVDTRGIRVESIALGTVTLPDEDAEIIKQAQRQAMLVNPAMGAAALTQAQADAMKMAASNSNGAAMGFMGMNMAAQTGGVNAQALYQMAANQQAQQAQQAQNAAGQEGWKCSCGAVNLGKFCTECGAKKPAGAPLYRCDKCGWQPADPTNPPKFCPECGDIFDENDVQ